MSVRRAEQLGLQGRTTRVAIRVAIRAAIRVAIRAKAMGKVATESHQYAY